MYIAHHFMAQDSHTVYVIKILQNSINDAPKLSYLDALMLMLKASFMCHLLVVFCQQFLG